MSAFDQLRDFLHDLRQEQGVVSSSPATQSYLESGDISRAIYTAQQAIGCVADSFTNQNQARKRVGQLFETLITLVIRELGFPCEPRTISIPIPGAPGLTMPYQLDLVFSGAGALMLSETHLIHPREIVGSVKTTSKDRLDKIFLDKHLLTKLLGRDIPVVAIFLHDVQRVAAPARFQAERDALAFCVGSTFKRRHFLGYTAAFARLDGVYYVDPRPEMATNPLLAQQIHDFQRFLVTDLWQMSK